MARSAQVSHRNEQDTCQRHRNTHRQGSGDEFSVGSFLLPRLRPHVAIFYNLARATDDIADNGELTPEDKLSRLDRFEKALTGNVMGDPDLQKPMPSRKAAKIPACPFAIASTLFTPSNRTQ